jgi:hypothetical protein
MHAYSEGVDVSPARFGDSDLAGAALLTHIHSLALQNGKKLYVGEFGELNGGGGTCGGEAFTCAGDATKWYSRRFLDAVVREGVEYAGVWAFEAYEDVRCPAVPDCYTVTNTDPFMDYLATREKAYGSCAAAADGAGCPGGTCTGKVCLPPLTPPPTAPSSIAHFAFFTAADITDWLAFTNCSGCTPGTFTVDSGQKLARLVTYDLPCTGSCAYPGTYAATPLVPVQPGHLSIRFMARSTTPSARVQITAFDAQNKPIDGYDLAVTTSTESSSNGITFKLPDATASVGATAAVLAPDSTLELISVDLDWQP